MRQRPSADSSGQAPSDSAIGSRLGSRGATLAARIPWRTSSSSIAVGNGSRPVTAKWQHCASGSPPTPAREHAHVQPSTSVSNCA